MGHLTSPMPQQQHLSCRTSTRWAARPSRCSSSSSSSSSSSRLQAVPSRPTLLVATAGASPQDQDDDGPAPLAPPTATLRTQPPPTDRHQHEQQQQSATRRALLSALGGVSVASAALTLGLPGSAAADEAAADEAAAAGEGSSSAAAAEAEAAPELALAAEMEAAEPEAPSPSPAPQADASTSGGGTKAYFKVAIEGEPVGTIVVQLFNDVKVGSARFRDLSQGKEGVGYRLSRIDGIFETHLRVEGVKRLSYSATGDSSIAGGDSVAELEAEMSGAVRTHDQGGLVSLMVKEASERPIQEKLIAKGGKLVTIQLQAGEAPNGTGFMITRGPAPALDATNLVVGRVVEGMDIVERVAALPFSKPRVEWYDGPFFQAGKAMGDKRATVAEKGFNRPFKRVIITSSGLA